MERTTKHSSGKTNDDCLSKKRKRNHDLVIDAVVLSTIYLALNVLPCYSKRKGAVYVNEILNHRNPERCKKVFRMEPPLFRRLCNTLETEYGIRGSRSVSLEEKVGIFLYVVGHGASPTSVQEAFHHSIETIHCHFDETLKAMVKFTRDRVTPKDPKKITNCYPFFKDCIGVIGTTRIPAHLPLDERRMFMDRDSKVSQNVLAVCDFDYRFSYIICGGDSHSDDSFLLKTLLDDEVYKFPKPPKGKYYLVDGKFADRDGYPTPYRLQYSQKFEKQELDDHQLAFNTKHSLLGSIVERVFAIWKKRFKILTIMPNYSFNRQMMIVAATAGLHNFLVENDSGYADNADKTACEKECTNDNVDQGSSYVVATRGSKVNKGKKGNIFRDSTSKKRNVAGP